MFQQFTDLKSLFIYPTGILVNAFNGIGVYTDAQWIYIFDQTRFVLGESCSGTTFFSLLLAYLLYSHARHKTSLAWLLLAYPATLIANSMRVLSSMYAHSFLAYSGAEKYSDAIHVLTGTITFLSCLLAIAFLIDKTKDKPRHG